MPAPTDHVYLDVAGVASVRWDESTSTVLVQWQGWANSEEFAALLDAEVRAFRDHGGSRLLADCRLQRVLNPQDQERADREWLPRALEAGLKRFAIILPTSQLAAMNLQDRLARIPGTVLEVGYFSSVEEATAWLAR